MVFEDQKKNLSLVLWLVGLLFGVGSAGFFGADASHLLGALIAGLGLCLAFCDFDRWQTDSDVKDVGRLPFSKSWKLWIGLLFYVVSICFLAKNALIFASISLVAIAFFVHLRPCCWVSHGWPCLALFLWHVIFALAPPLQQYLLTMSIATTQFFSGLAPVSSALGPTYFGIDALILWLAVISGRLSISSRPLWQRAVVLVLAAVIWSSLVVFLAAYLPQILSWILRNLALESVGHYHTNLAQSLSYMPLLLLVVLTIGFVGISHFIGKPESSYPQKNIPGLKKLMLVIVIGFLLGILPAGRFLGGSTESRRIVFIDQGMMDFQLPSFDQFGIVKAGMFGLFEQGLKDSDYEVSHLASLAELDLGSENHPDLVVMINPIEVDVEQANHLLRFVFEGGNVLLIGDHTDIGGTKSSLDKLLTPLGGSFRFDSGFPVRKGWAHKYNWFYHPSTLQFDRLNYSFQQSTGATLALQGMGWYPIVTGTYTFSDLGNRLNSEDAYLGNYAYEPGEILGDLCVVAERTYGKGKMVIFGDTSAFQNVSIAYAWPFVERLIRSLIQPRWISHVWIHGFGLILFGLAFYFCRGVPLLWASLALSLLFSSLVSQRIVLTMEKPNSPQLPLAIVDVSHANQLTLEHWRDQSIDGFMINLHRNGYWPIIMNAPKGAIPEQTSLFTLMAPKKELSPDFQEKLLKRVNEGMTLLITCGYEESAEVTPFLDRLGCLIMDVPLGPVPVRRKLSSKEFAFIRNRPQFSEAWPLKYDLQEGWEARYVWENYAIVAEKKLGNGRIIVIGDTKFLWNRTLETEKEAWPGNVFFLRQLIEQECSLVGGDVKNN